MKPAPPASAPGTRGGARSKALFRPPNTLTFGVNWYLRSNFKLAANYVKVDSSKYSSTAKATLDDNPGIMEFRAQFFW